MSRLNRLKSLRRREHAVLGETSAKIKTNALRTKTQKISEFVRKQQTKVSLGRYYVDAWEELEKKKGPFFKLPSTYFRSPKHFSVVSEHQ